MNWKCEKVAESRHAYLDETLSTPEREELERHLAICSTCCSAIEELRGTWALLDRFEPVEPGGSFIRNTLEAVSRDRIETRRTWLRRTVTVAAAGLVIAASVLFQRGGSPGAPPDTKEEIVAEAELLESLDLIEDLDFLLEYGEDLELAMECDLYDLLSEGGSL